MKHDVFNGIRLDNGNLPSFAWPGGYPLYYLDDVNSVLCPDCANKDGQSSEPVAVSENYEDHELYCEDCGQRIPAAYDED